MKNKGRCRGLSSETIGEWPKIWLRAGTDLHIQGHCQPALFCAWVSLGFQRSAALVFPRSC